MGTWSGVDPGPNFGSHFATGYRGPLHRRAMDFASRQMRRPVVNNVLFPARGMQPMEWFGFAMRGAPGDQRKLSYLGMRVGRGPGPRFWIPDPQKPWSGVGQWGTFKQAEAGFKSAMSTAPTGFSKFKRAATIVGGRFLFPVFGLWDWGSRFSHHRAQGESLLPSAVKAAAGVGASALMFTLGFKMLNPITLAAAIPLAIGVGHIAYRNKMADYSKQVKRTEFVGDMSAFETRSAYTMRQRSMQSIERSYLGARNVLGSEARYRHMRQSQAFAMNPSVWGRQV